MEKGILNFEANKLSTKEMAELNGGMQPATTEVGTEVDCL